MAFKGPSWRSSTQLLGAGRIGGVKGWKQEWYTGLAEKLTTLEPGPSDTRNLSLSGTELS